MGGSITQERAGAISNLVLLIQIYSHILNRDKTHQIHFMIQLTKFTQMVCTRKLRSTCTRERKEEPSLIICQHNVCYYVHAVSIFCILHPLPDYMVPLVERYQLGKVCIPQLSDGCHVPLPPKRVNPMVRVVKRMVVMVMVMTVIVFSCIVTQLVNFFFPPLHFNDRSDECFPDQRRTLRLTLRPHSSCTTHICIYQLNFLSI